MGRVLKFELPEERGEFILVLPTDAINRLLTTQSNKPIVYMECESDRLKELNCIAVYTGDVLNKEYPHYLGTAMLYNESFVLHYYFKN